MVYDEINNTYYCDECGCELKLNCYYDAYFCPDCDTWAEKKCEDEFCPFCLGRPNKPSEVK